MFFFQRKERKVNSGLKNNFTFSLLLNTFFTHIPFEFKEFESSLNNKKISGMAGDGAFCKSNEPFKSQMKKHFGDNFKFRWDLLHLVNRAHVDCLAQVKELKQF